MIAREKMEREDIKNRVVDALKNFGDGEDHLLKVDAHELAIASALAGYLRTRFRGYSVDCDYNRDGKDKKRLPREGRVRPDIIVHRRGRAGPNILVLS